MTGNYAAVHDQLDRNRKQWYGALSEGEKKQRGNRIVGRYEIDGQVLIF